MSDPNLKPDMFEKFILKIYSIYRDPKQRFLLKRTNDNLVKSQLFSEFRYQFTKENRFAFNIISEVFIHYPYLLKNFKEDKTSLPSSLRELNLTESFSRRFKKLVDMKTTKEIYESNILMKILSLISGQQRRIVVNYYQLLKDLFYWGDKTRERWIWDYYMSTSDIISSETKE